MADAALVLASASAGFLVWNWPPAKVFMGDVGSGFLGFVFGVLAISGAKERPWLLWVWLILLSVFIVDATLTLMRRLITGARWYDGALQSRLSARRPGVGQPLESDFGHCGGQVAWLFPLAWGACVWPVAGPFLAVAALAPLVYAVFRYDAGRGTSAAEGAYVELKSAWPRSRGTIKAHEGPGIVVYATQERMMRKALEFMNKLTKIHRLAVWVVQLGVFALSGVAAFLLRFDLALPTAYLKCLAYALPIWLVVKSVVFRLAGLDRGWWRYVSVTDLLRIVVGNFAASVLSCIAILFIAPAGFPRSICLLDLMICFLGTAGVRMIVRMTAEGTSNGSNGAAEKNTLIYGAGAAGVTLLREIQRNPKLLYRVRGFLDDWPDKKGIHILGVSVLGGGGEVELLVTKYEIDTILIAIPSATGSEMTRILGRCHACGVVCKTVPGLGDVIEERGLAGQIREVAVEDLLGRNPVRLEENQIRGTLEGKVVLVTGAAGSIGSELCRQIARFHPAGIVGFEIAESPLFEIDREMRQAFPQMPFYAEIGSIQNRARLDEVLRQYSPSVVYHAAAYKHVPMMEAHVFEAIENNVFGTYNVALAAAEHGVEDFVMISSDKAVRPTNVMGATKRVAELLLLALQNGRTKYVAVRFGNVLGSNGSVIPIFKKQIAAGGPVTVTHPEMRRFFMTIPEACQLVLQAAVIGRADRSASWIWASRSRSSIWPGT